MSRTLAAAIAVGLLLTAGCGGDTTRTADPASPRAGAETSGSPSPSAGARAGDRAGDDSRRARPRARASRRALASQPPVPAPSVSLRPLGRTSPWLAAADFGRDWRAARRGRENGRLVSDCQRAPLVAIGALRSRIREFAGKRSSARQAVSTFADRKSAWRAQQVLDTWREDCADALADRDAALGAVRHRTRLSVVEVDGTSRAQRRLDRLLAKVSDGFEA
ncbi:hypothetical protein [Nocardioides coralli]|uniref:hypothetical protein n=1 Tax=Nocardioides coralli TaxID=2872154 RepID=UPI001CA3C0E6|nr:hypothetical protein [Nocardioides coralli]QZY29767.1 hypothetical protein K6T13_03495 [Nocardioides coralli]